MSISKNLLRNWLVFVLMLLLPVSAMSAQPGAEPPPVTELVVDPKRLLWKVSGKLLEPVASDVFDSGSIMLGSIQDACERLGVSPEQLAHARCAGLVDFRVLSEAGYYIAAAGRHLNVECFDKQRLLIVQILDAEQLRFISSSAAPNSKSAAVGLVKGAPFSLAIVGGAITPWYPLRGARFHSTPHQALVSRFLEIAPPGQDTKSDALLTAAKSVLLVSRFWVDGARGADARLAMWKALSDVMARFVGSEQSRALDAVITAGGLKRHTLPESASVVAEALLAAGQLGEPLLNGYISVNRGGAVTEFLRDTDSEQSVLCGRGSQGIPGWMAEEQQAPRDTSDSCGTGKHEPKPGAEAEEPPQKEAPRRMAYLTFDDAPNSLRACDAWPKAGTCNVFCRRYYGASKRSDPQRDQATRHALGNHSFDHNYDDIYRSAQSCIASLKKCEHVLYSIVCERPKNHALPAGAAASSQRSTMKR